MIQKYGLFRVVRQILRHSGSPFTLKSISKRSGVSLSTSKRAMDYLESKRIVKRVKIGNVHQFRLNSESLVVRQMKVLDIVSELTYSGVLDEIVEKCKPVSVVLYGSCAIGTCEEKSDVDLLIISKRKKVMLKEKISRELSYKIYSMDEWRKKAKEDKVFYDRVIINSICLYGEKPVVI